MLSAKSTWKEVCDAKPDTAILPIGAFEQHGHHLPLGTDWYGAQSFAQRLAERLGNVLLLPAVPYGCSIEHLPFPGTVTLRPSTLAAILEDIADSLRRHGIKYLIVHSSHGGNWILKPTLREINFRHPDMVLLWDNGCLPEQGEKPPEDIHSGRNETSSMLFLHPDLVRDYAAQPDSPGIVGQEFNDYVGYDKTTKTGAWGRPVQASAEFGKERVEQALDRCVRYIEWAKQRVEELRRNKGCASE